MGQCLSRGSSKVETTPTAAQATQTSPQVIPATLSGPSSTTKETVTSVTETTTKTLTEAAAILPNAVPSNDQLHHRPSIEAVASAIAPPAHEPSAEIATKPQDAVVTEMTATDKKETSVEDPAKNMAETTVEAKPEKVFEEIVVEAAAVAVEESSRKDFSVHELALSQPQMAVQPDTVHVAVKASERALDLGRLADAKSQLEKVQVLSVASAVVSQPELAAAAIAAPLVSSDKKEGAMSLGMLVEKELATTVAAVKELPKDSSTSAFRLQSQKIAMESKPKLDQATSLQNVPAKETEAPETVETQKAPETTKSANQLESYELKKEETVEKTTPETTKSANQLESYELKKEETAEKTTLEKAKSITSSLAPVVVPSASEIDKVKATETASKSASKPNSMTSLERMVDKSIENLAKSKLTQEVKDVKVVDEQKPSEEQEPEKVVKKEENTVVVADSKPIDPADSQGLVTEVAPIEKTIPSEPLDLVETEPKSISSADPVKSAALVDEAQTVEALKGDTEKAAQEITAEQTVETKEESEKTKEPIPDASPIDKSLELLVNRAVDAVLTEETSQSSDPVKDVATSAEASVEPSRDESTTEQPSLEPSTENATQDSEEPVDASEGDEKLTLQKMASAPELESSAAKTPLGKLKSEGSRPSSSGSVRVGNKSRPSSGSSTKRKSKRK